MYFKKLKVKRNSKQCFLNLISPNLFACLLSWLKHDFFLFCSYKVQNPLKNIVAWPLNTGTPPIPRFSYTAVFLYRCISSNVVFSEPKTVLNFNLTRFFQNKDKKKLKFQVQKTVLKEMCLYNKSGHSFLISNFFITKTSGK